MSIYATPISQLRTSDLAELLQEQAVENTRLELAKLQTLIQQGHSFNNA